MKVNWLEMNQMIRELEQKLLDLLWKEEMREDVLADDPYYSWNCIDEYALENGIKEVVGEFILRTSKNQTAQNGF